MNQGNRIPQLPKHSGIVDSILFHRIRDAIMNFGSLHEPTKGIVVKRQGCSVIAFPDGDENAEAIMKIGDVHWITWIYVCEHARDEAEEALVEIVGQNLVSFFSGYVPRRYHDKFTEEFLVQAGLLTDAGKEHAWRYFKEQMKELKGPPTNVVSFESFIQSNHAPAVI